MKLYVKYDNSIQTNALENLKNQPFCSCLIMLNCQSTSAVTIWKQHNPVVIHALRFDLITHFELMVLSQLISLKCGLANKILSWSCLADIIVTEPSTACTLVGELGMSHSMQHKPVSCTRGPLQYKGIMSIYRDSNSTYVISIQFHSIFYFKEKHR